MSSRRNPRRLAAAVLVGVLAGGGLMATTPAGAEVAQSAATNWKKIWKKKIQPQADKRYYKKADSDARYAASSSLADFYDKTAADARFQPKGSYAPAGAAYTKAESDARYAAVPTLIRGTYGMEDSAGPVELLAPISFGTTLSAPPTPHFIAAGAAVPVGCSGTVAAPNASPGHLCIFEGNTSNVGLRNVFMNSGFGAVAYIRSSTTGTPVWSVGSWAVRPVAFAPLPSRAGTSGGVNGTAPEPAGRSAAAER